jgi:hypothetical protein
MNGPNHLSILGIIHTIISVVALVVALIALAKKGRVDPASSTGKLYVWLTVLTCFTGFPIMKTGHLTPGHYLAIIISILLPVGIYPAAHQPSIGNGIKRSDHTKRFFGPYRDLCNWHSLPGIQITYSEKKGDTAGIVTFC